MLFLMIPSPTWADSSCKALWCNAWGKIGNWYDTIVSPPSVKKRGKWSRGPLRVALLGCQPILEAKKGVVYIGWMGGKPPYKVNVAGNGKSWEKNTEESVVAIKATEFGFETGKQYMVTISCCNGQQKKIHQLKVVNNVLNRFSESKRKELAQLLSSSRGKIEQQLSNEEPDEVVVQQLSKLKKVIRATWLANQGRSYMLEAYQQIAGIEEADIGELKKGLEVGMRPRP
jgi:hypothetical protein